MGYEHLPNAIRSEIVRQGERAIDSGDNGEILDDELIVAFDQRTWARAQKYFPESVYFPYSRSGRTQFMNMEVLIEPIDSDLPRITVLRRPKVQRL